MTSVFVRGGVLRWRVFHTAVSVLCSSDGGFFHLFDEKRIFSRTSCPYAYIFTHILSVCLLDSAISSEHLSADHVLFCTCSCRW
jgi:hypothetical protein